MGVRRQNSGLFDALRREGALFALVGTLTLLVHVFQPWAAARAADAAQYWTICTAFGMAIGTPDGKDIPPPGHADDCVKCIGNACCGFAAKPRMLPAGEPAHPVLAASRVSFAFGRREPIPFGRLNAPPPAIRAPPGSA
jgi:hypothetical protein